MNPFFFGSSRKQLFGIHHPPKGQVARRTGILLCYPFGDEYMRTHKAMRQLTLQLAKAGFHLLRFDYFGTGDSAGDGEEATIEQWVEDIGVAADELKENAGVTRISLVGLRLGGALAARAAAPRADVEDLLLWDPVVAGRTYFEELMLAPGQSISDPTAPPAPDETVGVSGFPVSPALRAGLERLDLCEEPLTGPRRLLLVASHERADYDRLKEEMRARHMDVGSSPSPEEMRARPGFVYRHVPSPAPWIEPEKSGGAMVLPHEIIQAIVMSLSGSESA